MSHNLHNNLGNWCIFPENKLIYQGKWLKPQIVSGAEIMEYFPAAQRRGNKYYFVASKDDCGCCSCRYAAKSSVICRTSSRQLQIRYDQQRDKLFPPTSTLNILSLLVADIMVLTLAALRSFVQTVFCLLVSVGHIWGVSEPHWFWEVPSSFQRWLCPITYTQIWEIGVFSLKINLFIRENG